MTAALVLNAGFEPLSVVSSRRAIIIALDGKADVLESAQPIMSTSGLVEVPIVLRLRYHVKAPYRVQRRRPNLQGLKLRDGKACSYGCGRSSNTVDHILPTARGGGDTWENTCGACHRCNNGKGDRTPAEANMSLRVTPYLPEGWLWLIAATSQRDPSWEQYFRPFARNDVMLERLFGLVSA